MTTLAVLLRAGFRDEHRLDTAIRHRLGDELPPVRKLWSASNVKLYLGGVAEAEFLRELSELAGDYDNSTGSVSYNRGIRSTNHQLRRERILDASELSVSSVVQLLERHRADELGFVGLL